MPAMNCKLTSTESLHSFVRVSSLDMPMRVRGENSTSAKITEQIIAVEAAKKAFRPLACQYNRQLRIHPQDLHQIGRFCDAMHQADC